jgi:predicted amidophosphoribosyltransferase
VICKGCGKEFGQGYHEDYCQRCLDTLTAFMRAVLPTFGKDPHKHVSPMDITRWEDIDWARAAFSRAEAMLRVLHKLDGLDELKKGKE